MNNHQEIETALTKLAGTPVALRNPGLGLWVAAPVDKALIKSKTWMALRWSKGSCVGSTPIEAGLLLATAIGAAGPIKSTKHTQARQWLRGLLGNGVPRKVSELRGLAQSGCISWDAADRAARDLGVIREKCGLSGPWVWQLKINLERLANNCGM